MNTRDDKLKSWEGEETGAIGYRIDADSVTLTYISLTQSAEPAKSKPWQGAVWSSHSQSGQKMLGRPHPFAASKSRIQMETKEQAD